MLDPSDLAAELKTYAARKHHARTLAGRARCRERLKARPVSCSVCREVKTTAIAEPPTCGACYLYQRRNGRPRKVGS
jgi:hypothetical protein